MNDYANVLASANRAALERKLVAYFDSTSTQIVVVTERTADGSTPFDRSFAFADKWGVGGTADRDNGILLYVAVDDRQIYIQTGYGVEDRVTDAMAKRIIDQIMVPAFRGGRYYDGINQATSAMIDLLAGRYASTGQAGSSGLSPFTVLLLFVIAFVLLSWLFSRGGGDDGDDGGYYRGGRYRGPRRRGGMVILPGGGFGGGGFGGGGGGFGGGGGGFGGGFGGGGFGGGGAGGGW